MPKWFKHVNCPTNVISAFDKPCISLKTCRKILFTSRMMENIPKQKRPLLCLKVHSYTQKMRPFPYIFVMFLSWPFRDVNKIFLLTCWYQNYSNMWIVQQMSFQPLTSLVSLLKRVGKFCLRHGTVTTKNDKNVWEWSHFLKTHCLYSRSWNKRTGLIISLPSFVITIVWKTLQAWRPFLSKKFHSFTWKSIPTPKKSDNSHTFWK
jgi:hypothetical protein